MNEYSWFNVMVMSLCTWLLICDFGTGFCSFLILLILHLAITFECCWCASAWWLSVWGILLLFCTHIHISVEDFHDCAKDTQQILINLCWHSFNIFPFCWTFFIIIDITLSTSIDIIVYIFTDHNMFWRVLCGCIQIISIIMFISYIQGL